MLPDLFATFERNDDYMRAWIRAPHAQPVRELNWQRRARSIAEGLPRDGVLAGDEQARRFAGLVLVLAGSATWHAVRTVSDLRGADAGRLAAWALRALLDAAEHDPDGLAAVLNPE